MANSIIFSATSEEKSYHALKNYGVYRTATEFRMQGLSCQVIQFFNYFENNDITNLIDKFSENLIVVGFSALFWTYYDQNSKNNLFKKINFIVKHLRNNYPKIKIIAGGPSSKIFLDDNLEKIDAIFEGFSENDFIPYIRNLKYNEKKHLPNNFVKNISLYNNIYGNFDFNYSNTVYEKNDFITKNDTPILEVGRGCIFRCKFCGFALNGKKKFDYLKNQETLKKELIYNYENYGITNYLLSDDTFNDSLFKVESLHKIFTNLPFKIKFACYLRLDLLIRFPEEIRLLKEMGLIGTFFGIETFNKDSSKLIGKGLDPDVAKKWLNDLKKIYWGDDIKIGIGLIAGLPYETYESVEQTKEWINDENNLVDQVIPFPLMISNPKNMRPQPWDSEFQRNAEKYGFSWPGGDSYNWHNKNNYKQTWIEAKILSDEYGELVSKTSRWKQGGFNLLKSFPLISSQPNAPKLIDLIKMNRFEYTKYIKNLEKKPELKTYYINSYINNLYKI